MDQGEFLDRIADEFRIISEKYFADFFIYSRGYSGPSFRAAFHPSNSYFKNTGYYYNKGNKFAHFTSVPVLFSILNDRVIRLYNLQNSNDPEEYNHQAKVLQLDRTEIERKKENVYTFSFCSIEDLENQYVWREYASNFSGVCIEFDIENDISKWNNFHISEMKYEPNKNIAAYAKELDDLKRRYRNATFDHDLSKVIAFHKKPDSIVDNEIRILTYYPFKNYDEFRKASKTVLKLEKGRNRVTKYIDLELWVKNDSPYLEPRDKDFDRRKHLQTDYWNDRPQIKITKIWFGCNCGLSTSEYSDTRDRIKEFFPYNFGYQLNMSLGMVKPENMKFDSSKSTD